MKKYVVAAFFALGAFLGVSAQAAPTTPMSVPAVSNDTAVQKVHYYGYRRYGYYRPYRRYGYYRPYWGYRRYGYYRPYWGYRDYGYGGPYAYGGPGISLGFGF